MKFVKVTCLALKEGTDGNENIHAKTPMVIDFSKVENFFEHEWMSKYHIIGEDKLSQATSVMMTSGRRYAVIETNDQLLELILGKK